MANSIFSTSIGRFRIISFAEGISYLLLLGIAVPIKYACNMPDAVQVPGMLHGVLFVTYIALLIIATLSNKWSFKNAILLFIASIFPFGFLLAEKMFLKKQAKTKAA